MLHFLSFIINQKGIEANILNVIIILCLDIVYHIMSKMICFIIVKFSIINRKCRKCTSYMIFLYICIILKMVTYMIITNNIVYL